MVMTIVGRKYDVNSVVAATFYWLASRALNITVELEGAEHLETRPAVMIGNHQSMLDILWLGRWVPINFILSSHDGRACNVVRRGRHTFAMCHQHSLL